MAYRIVVTEVTLYGRLRCVAGFDLDRGVMIRPEPEPAGFWEAKVCGPNTTFHPGHVVEFRGERPQTALPHNTEDIVVGGGSPVLTSWSRGRRGRWDRSSVWIGWRPAARSSKK